MTWTVVLLLQIWWELLPGGQTVFQAPNPAQGYTLEMPQDIPRNSSYLFCKDVGSKIFECEWKKVFEVTNCVETVSLNFQCKEAVVVVHMKEPNE